MRHIFVENLGELTRDELQAALSQHGNVNRVNITTDGAIGLPSAFHFVETSAPNGVDDAARLYGKLTPTASPKLLSCWRQAHTPTAQIEEIASLATTVLEDSDKAVKWLSEANPATDDRAPIELIGEAQGFERVKNLLLRIEYGVLA